MDFCFATFATLSVLLFSVTFCAPTGSQDACADVRSSSLGLNQIARNVSVEARKRLEKDGEALVNTSLAWIEATDMCDPETLKQKSMPCVGKMLRVLEHYVALVNSISVFGRCSDLASQVMPEIQKLYKDMTKCAKSTGGWSDEKESHVGEKDKTGDWEGPFLCHYTLDRLFSFSILTARVFARGDPAHHTSGTAQKCV